MPVGDFWDQRVLTRTVRRNIEEEAQGPVGGGENRAFSGSTIAPLVSVQSRTARIRVVDVLPYGMGQFKAPDATPPLYKPKPTLKEYVVELALLEEMERFQYEEWLKLNSTDPAIARGEMLSLVDRYALLQKRNDQLTEWMRWQAFKGTLAITYPDGGSVTIDYGISGTHTPTAGTAWTDTVNADIIEDLNTWGQVGADDIGQFYSIVHLNNNTWRLIQRNQKIQGYLGQLGRQIMLPTTSDLQALLKESTSNFQIVDSGYLPDGATNRQLTKFIPNNRVLMTTSYVVDGQRIADVADGLVLVNTPDRSEPVARQGMQSELISNPFSKNVFRRQASARIPRLHLPEAFLYATVGA